MVHRSCKPDLELVRHETGRLFDVGFATDEIRPIINLDPLAGKNSKKSDAPDEGSSDFDATCLTMLSTAKEMGYTVSSAFGALHLLAGAIRSDTAQLDKKLARRWCGHMLRSGQIFQLHGQTLLSLGFHGFAALVFRVCHICLPDGSHIFSLWDSCQALVSSPVVFFGIIYFNCQLY